MGVVFVRQFVHLVDHFFCATQFDHGLSEPCITNEPMVNVRVSSFPDTSFGVDLQCGILDHFLSVLVTMWSALPDVKVRDREEIKN